MALQSGNEEGWASLPAEIRKAEDISYDAAQRAAEVLRRRIVLSGVPGAAAGLGFGVGAAVQQASEGG